LKARGGHDHADCPALAVPVIAPPRMWIPALRGRSSVCAAVAARTTSPLPGAGFSRRWPRRTRAASPGLSPAPRRRPSFGTRSRIGSAGLQLARRRAAESVRASKP